MKALLAVLLLFLPAVCAVGVLSAPPLGKVVAPERRAGATADVEAVALLMLALAVFASSAGARGDWGSGPCPRETSPRNVPSAARTARSILTPRSPAKASR